MILDVDVVACRDADKVWTHLFGVIDFCACFNAVCFCLIAGGNGAGIVGIHRNNSDRFATKGRVFLLFYGCEIAVQVQEQPFQSWCGLHG